MTIGSFDLTANLWRCEAVKKSNETIKRLFHLDHSHASFLKVHRNLYALNIISSSFVLLGLWVYIVLLQELRRGCKTCCFFRFTVNRASVEGIKERHAFWLMTSSHHSINGIEVQEHHFIAMVIWLMKFLPSDSCLRISESLFKSDRMHQELSWCTMTLRHILPIIRWKY